MTTDRPRQFARLLVQAFVVVFLVSLILGQLLGQPVLLGFVETGSMRPALAPGDGFVAIPSELGGPVDEGDIVVFRAERVNDGRLTTHRVVDVTGDGFVTKGDANPFTDQANGEPPVTRAQIVAKVLVIGGHPVVIPGLGTFVEGSRSALASLQGWLAVLFGTRAFLGVQGLAALVAGAALAAYVVSVLLERDDSERPERDRSRTGTGVETRSAVLVLSVLLVLAATVAMVGPSGTQEFTLVSTENEDQRPLYIQAGSSSTVQYDVSNGGIVPVVVFFEPTTDRIDPSATRMRVSGKESRSVEVEVSAPPEVGIYPQYLTEHRYLAVLPLPVIRWLYVVHPWLPVVVIDALIGVTFYALGTALVGTGRIRSRARGGKPLVTRLHRAFRKVYKE